MPELTARQKRTFVIERAAGCCEYCRSQAAFSSDSFSVEHIWPLSKGGTDALENLAFACQGCNNRKFTSTHVPDPTDGRIAPLFHPRNDKWAEHFQWDTAFQTLIGLTPTGRATIERLQLNRDGVVNLRRALFKLKKHPPANFT